MSTSNKSHNLVSPAFFFPYEYKYIEEGTIPNPRITIEIHGRQGFFPVKFLVDTGADVTTLPFKVFAPFIDFRKSEKDKIIIRGVEGSGVNAYPYLLSIKVGNKVLSIRSYLLESPIEPLLGRLDFWNFFSLTFDNRKKQTILNALKSLLST